MTLLIANRYTTLANLIVHQGERDIADACDPTGQSQIDDEIVQERIYSIIYSASREIDAYLIKHMTIPIPEDITALTVGTSITMTNGSHAVVGVGTDFVNELRNGDEIYLPDDEAFWFGVVDSITDALNLTLKYQYNGTTTIATVANRRRITVPGWLEMHARHYALYTMWARRGRYDADNPWNNEKEASRKALIDFQNSKQKFDDGGTKRKHNPIRAERAYADRAMTSTSLARFTDPDVYPNIGT